LTLASLFVVQLVRAATIAENFASDPLQHGWQIFGNPNLFRWNATNQNLEVTWDSTQTNSYYYQPLGTTVTRHDDFSIAFDLRLDDIGPGPAPSKSNSFELTIGFFNLNEATTTNFVRATGYDSPNLVEFDYFWDSGYGATVMPAIVGTNSDFNYNGASDYAIYPLTPGDWYHVQMTYTAPNQTLVTTFTNLAQNSGGAVTQLVNGAFSDYRVDTLAISSFSDAGQDPMWGEGSILAHGAVDNIAVIVPALPAHNLAGGFTNGNWQVQFSARANWLFMLERTVDFQTWTELAPAVSGITGTMSLIDTNPPVGHALYRIRASRP